MVGVRMARHIVQWLALEWIVILHNDWVRIARHNAQPWTLAGTRSGLTAQVGVCVCVRVCILQNSPIALSLPLQASRGRGERGGDGQDSYRRYI